MLFLDEPPQAESERSRPRGRAELLRVIELDSHEVGQDTANWTTERLASYLGQHTGIQVTEETVRVYLHAHGYGGLASCLDTQAQGRSATPLCGKREAR